MASGKGIRSHRYVKGTELKLMREMAQGGATCRQIMIAFKRPETTVRRYCRGLMRPVDQGSDRLIRILEHVEKSKVSRAVIAHDLGFASVNSLDVILTRGRRARAALMSAQTCR